MTEVLLLGTFHYLESHLDFYSYEIQSQLESLTEKLRQFEPDAVAIEAAVKAQKTIDYSYNKFSLSDLTDYELMKTKTLGDIEMFGSLVPITYNNEAIQIGYRLGKLLKLDSVYAIDDDTVLDMSTLDCSDVRVGKARDAFQRDMDKNRFDSIAELYRYYNSEIWTNLSHNIYVQMNSINSTNNSYDGSLMVTKWYERNLKIFSNIQNLALKSKKLFVLYGAGHLKILRELINADTNLALIDVNEYL